MITYWTYNNGLVESETICKNCWISVIKPTPEETDYLIEKLQVSPDVINDILDVDERSRYESDEQWITIILRIPIRNLENGLPFYTVPFGILISSSMIITICSAENDVIHSILANRMIDFKDLSNFVMHIFMKTANLFHSYLKQINIQVANIETDLLKSTRNKELHQMLKMEKCLVYFITSLKSDEILLARLKSLKISIIGEFDEDQMDNVIIEFKQAMEMANIYSDIQSGMMDAFASVISNNLNVVMKQLASITIILMIPTFIASLYGMNVPNHFENNPFGFLWVLIISFILSGFGVFLFRRKNWF